MKFESGQTIATDSIVDDFKDKVGELFVCLDRHFDNDCDNKNNSDRDLNELAIINENGKVTSVYYTSVGKIYIVTEGLHLPVSERETNVMHSHEYKENQ